MTTLYGAAQGVRALKAESLAAHKAKTPRYHLKAGNQYLFWDGSKLTPNRDWAWSGTVEQARACRRKFAAAAGCRLRAITPKPPVYVEELA